VLPAGTELGLAELRSLARSGPSGVAGISRPVSGDSRPVSSAVPGPTAILMEITDATAERFGAAAAARDAPGMTAAVLDLEAAISDWAADTEEDQGTPKSRAVLRGLVTRLGQVAADAGNLPAAAGPLLDLRSDLRDQGLFAAADTIRDALTAVGLVIQDTAEGTRWALPSR